MLALAVLIDRTAGESPSGLHPVVWLGRLARAVRGAFPHRWQHTVRGGTVLVVTVVGVAWWAGKTLTGITRRVPFGIAIIVEAMLLKPLFAVRALHEHGALVHVALDATDLHGVRSAVGP